MRNERLIVNVAIDDWQAQVRCACSVVEYPIDCDDAVGVCLLRDGTARVAIAIEAGKIATTHL